MVIVTDNYNNTCVYEDIKTAGRVFRLTKGQIRKAIDERDGKLKGLRFSVFCRDENFQM